MFFIIVFVVNCFEVLYPSLEPLLFIIVVPQLLSRIPIDIILSLLVYSTTNITLPTQHPIYKI